MKSVFQKTVLITLSVVLTINTAMARGSQDSQTSQLQEKWKRHTSLVNEKLYLEGILKQFEVVSKAYSIALNTRAKLQDKNIGTIPQSLVDTYNSQFEAFMQIKKGFVEYNSDFYSRYPHPKKSANELKQSDLDVQQSTTYISHKSHILLSSESESYYGKKSTPTLKEEIEKSRLELLLLDPQLKSATGAYEKAVAIQKAHQAIEELKKQYDAKAQQSDENKIKSFMSGLFLGLLALAFVASIAAIALKATLIAVLTIALFGTFAKTVQSSYISSGLSGHIDAFFVWIATFLATPFAAVFGPFYLGVKIADRHFGVLSNDDLNDLYEDVRDQEKRLSFYQKQYSDYVQKNEELIQKIDQMIAAGAEGDQISRQLVIP